LQEDESASYESNNLDLNYGKPNCTGSITVYSKSKLRGDSLKVDESLCQLYHVDFSQRIVSLRSEGNCCWILFQVLILLKITVQELMANYLL
jgi:hypothetical protein